MNVETKFALDKLRKATEMVAYLEKENDRLKAELIEARGEASFYEEKCRFYESLLAKS